MVRPARLSRLFVTAIPLGLLLLPQVASAARPRGDEVELPDTDPPVEDPPPPPDDPVPCHKPTLAQCQDARLMPATSDRVCRRTQMKDCGTMLEPLLTAHVKALSSPEGAVLVPANQALLLQRARAFDPVAQAPAKLTMGALSYQTSAQKSRVMPPISSQAFTGAQHPTWEANGARVASCAEYAFESYYDHSRFLEAADSCGRDADCVYRLAQLTMTPGLVHEMRKKNGKPMAWQPTHGAQTPVARKKNIFFAYDPIYLRDMPAYASDAAFRAKAEQIIAHVNATAGHNAPSQFAWHKNLHDRYPTNVSPPEALDIKQRLATYSAAVDTYSAAVWVVKLLEPLIEGSSGTRREGLLRELAKYRAARDASAPVLVQGLFAEWDHASVLDATSKDQGCLARNTTKCDWAPDDFVVEYTSVNRRQREAEFSRCIDGTGDDFSKVPAVASIDSDAFSAWLESNTVPKLAPARIGQRASDSETYGDKALFAAGYNYDAGWSLYADRQPGSNRICKLKGEGHARAGASAWAFGAEMKVLDTNTYLSVLETGRNISWHSHLKVLGFDTYNPIDGTVTLETIEKDAESDRTLFQRSFDKWIPVGPVFVHLQVAAELKVGMTAKLKALVSKEDCNPDNLAYDTTVSATPWMRAHATPSVSIGVVVLEAGVRGDIDLIAASVPISARANLQGTVNGVALNLGMDSTFVLEALRGDLKLFLRSCAPLLGCKDLATKQIYSWDGYRHQIPLLAYSKQLSLPVFDMAIGGSSPGKNGQFTLPDTTLTFTSN